jgi:hypothetical protein
VVVIVAEDAQAYPAASIRLPNVPPIAEAIERVDEERSARDVIPESRLDAGTQIQTIRQLAGAETKADMDLFGIHADAQDRPNPSRRTGAGDVRGGRHARESQNDHGG